MKKTLLTQTPLPWPPHSRPVSLTPCKGSAGVPPGSSPGIPARCSCLLLRSTLSTLSTLLTLLTLSTAPSPAQQTLDQAVTADPASDSPIKIVAQTPYSVAD